MTASVDLATQLMEHFAEATGLVGTAAPRRYLWTDAFGVCTFLGLARSSGEDLYRRRALELVDQVHRILGRHREDDPRPGWISGLDDDEGARHPTLGGLRIGKPLPEREPAEALNERLEWERDGQYFHYLTRWMHALHNTAGQTAEESYLTWGKELARVAHRAFTREEPGGRRRMVWKMSVDLSRPLVDSSGQHDPLDGLITYLELQTTDAGGTVLPDLRPFIAEAESMCRDIQMGTIDPLGIGGLLVDASRLAQIVLGRGLEGRGLLARSPRELLERLLIESSLSLSQFVRSYSPDAPANRRLPFRELGLSIGMRALEYAGPLLSREPNLGKALDSVLEFSYLGQEMEAFWSDPAHRRASTWRRQEDINTVTLATALAPEGYVALER